MAGYVSLTVDAPESDAELLEASLHEAGATGLEVRDRDAAMPNVRAPAQGEVILVAYFDDQDAAREALEQVRRSFPCARATLEAVAERDWSTEWKARIRPVEVGRLWVGPPWEAPPRGRVAIVIEPKMAFGTGDHPTTMLCLEAVDRYLSAHPGASVLDVGTGTGVLAIAAHKLGARGVVGIDNDPVAVELAREAASRNGAELEELSARTLDELDGVFDLVLANIVANTLVELAPAIASRTRDRLVLAGVLSHQQAEVEAAYCAQGLIPAGAKAMGEWVRIEMEQARSA